MFEDLKINGLAKKQKIIINRGKGNEDWRYILLMNVEFHRFVGTFSDFFPISGREKHPEKTLINVSKTIAAEE